MPYDNSNKIVLFTNDKKQGNQPDIKGSVNVEGVEYWVSIWRTPDKKTLATGQITKKDALKEAHKVEEPKVEDDLDDEFDSSIPF